MDNWYNFVMKSREISATDNMVTKIWDAQHGVSLKDLAPKNIAKDFVTDKNAGMDFLLGRLQYARIVVMTASRSGPNHDMPNPYANNAYHAGQEAISMIYQLFEKGGFPTASLDNIVPETSPRYDSTEDSLQALISLIS